MHLSTSVAIALGASTALAYRLDAREIRDYEAELQARSLDYDLDQLRSLQRRGPTTPPQAPHNGARNAHSSGKAPSAPLPNSFGEFAGAGGAGLPGASYGSPASPSSRSAFASSLGGLDSHSSPSFAEPAGAKGFGGPASAGADPFDDISDLDSNPWDPVGSGLPSDAAVAGGFGGLGGLGSAGSQATADPLDPSRPSASRLGGPAADPLSSFGSSHNVPGSPSSRNAALGNGPGGLGYGSGVAGAHGSAGHHGINRQQPQGSPKAANAAAALGGSARPGNGGLGRRAYYDDNTFYDW